jgi:Ca-activated chloride channel homolog
MAKEDLDMARKYRNFMTWFMIYITILLIVSGCPPPPSSMPMATELNIISGSENESLEPIFEKFKERYGVTLNMDYKGSLDIMRMLQQEQEIPYDAVWPASSLWLVLGDIQRNRVRDAESIWTSPVVLGIKEDLARKLDFQHTDVRVEDIQSAVQKGDLKFLMTSATQSNSGASAYLGFLHGLLNIPGGRPSTLEGSDLASSNLKEKIKTLLSGINRSSGSSGWLKDLFLAGNYDAIINYEALVIEINEKPQYSQNPLQIIYPVDSLFVADSPFGYVDNGDESKRELFEKFKQYLLSDEVQQKIREKGRRPPMEQSVQELPANIFRQDWGISTSLPEEIQLGSGPRVSELIHEALRRYQEEFRKPSFSIYCLDYSRSMEDYGGIVQLREAMSLLLDPNWTKTQLLQNTPQDITIVLPYSTTILDEWVARSPDEHKILLRKILELNVDRMTDIYGTLTRAFELIINEGDAIDKYIPAIILMTDGIQNSGDSEQDQEKREELFKIIEKCSKDIPIFSITLGRGLSSDDKEKQKQLIEVLKEATRGKIFSTDENLIEAFRKVRGYH